MGKIYFFEFSFVYKIQLRTFAAVFYGIQTFFTQFLRRTATSNENFTSKYISYWSVRL